MQSSFILANLSTSTLSRAQHQHISQWRYGRSARRTRRIGIILNRCRDCMLRECTHQSRFVSYTSYLRLRRLIFRTIQKLAHRQISEAHGRSNSQDSLNSHHANNDSFTTHDSTLTIPVPHRSDNQAKDRPSAGLLYTIPQSPGDATPENSDSRVDLQDTSTGNGENQEDGVEEGLYLKSKLWWVGLAMISIGEGGNFLSYAFAPASVVAPLGTVVSKHVLPGSSSLADHHRLW